MRVPDRCNNWVSGRVGLRIRFESRLAVGIGLRVGILGNFHITMNRILERERRGRGVG